MATTASLDELRPRMMSVAYRMLGSIADAEDAVQDGFLRLHSAVDVTSPEGFLVKTITRRCIDRLRDDRRRKNYVGPWVPEPVDTRATSNQQLADSLSHAFLLMLERLTPTERAAFILRTVFDYEYSEIADVLDKSEVHVRQIVSRARSRLQLGSTRFRASANDADSLAERFLSACRAGDVKLVEQLLMDDVEVHSDGGGKVTAARVVIRGRNRSARFLAGVFGKRRRDCEMRPANVNGAPGAVLTFNGAVVLVLSLHIENGVRAVYMINNPDKLARWSVAKID